jgi:hypothetical protein
MLIFPAGQIFVYTMFGLYCLPYTAHYMTFITRKLKYIVQYRYIQYTRIYRGFEIKKFSHTREMEFFLAQKQNYVKIRINL